MFFSPWLHDLCLRTLCGLLLLFTLRRLKWKPAHQSLWCDCWIVFWKIVYYWMQLLLLKVLDRWDPTFNGCFLSLTLSLPVSHTGKMNHQVIECFFYTEWPMVDGTCSDVFLVLLRPFLQFCERYVDALSDQWLERFRKFRLTVESQSKRVCSQIFQSASISASHCVSWRR